MDEIRLAPSEFAFLWEECPRCFWLKAARGIAPPRGGFPGIFSKIDSLAKGMFKTRKDLERVGIEGFAPVDFPASFRSERIAHGPHGQEWSVACKLDALWRHDEGWYCVPDLKTTDVKDAKLALYARQLHAYALALSRPDEKGRKALRELHGAESLDVRAVGLLCWTPASMGVKRAGDGIPVGALSGVWRWNPLPFDRDAFLGFLDEVLALCALEAPPPAAKGCERCKHVASVRALDPPLLAIQEGEPPRVLECEGCRGVAKILEEGQAEARPAAVPMSRRSMRPQAMR